MAGAAGDPAMSTENAIKALHQAQTILEQAREASMSPYVKADILRALALLEQVGEELQNDEQR